MRRLLLVSLLLIPQFSLAFELFKSEHQDFVFYQIPLRKVKKYLPNLIPIYQASHIPRIIAERKNRLFQDTNKIHGTFSLFKHRAKLKRTLVFGKVYSYVILADRIIFSEAKSNEISPRFDKHCVLSNFAQEVYFAGELKIKRNGTLYINNSSGTYRPKKDILRQVIKLIKFNLRVRAKIFTR